MNPVIPQLQQTQQRLLKLRNTTTYAIEDQHALREMLVTTILELQALYFDTVSSTQRIRVLHYLSVLEEEIPLYASSPDVSALNWQHLHESILASIESTLYTQVSDAP
ncbi:hypothetical protein [Hymenobacter sp. YC55]|uniref:hypothetical protein n=1 Tax=Hymenobacter sp. YC55 TaxID=3034019 RepID=UPI0023F71F17|nr:hypothetical protein [Hymenobacter sp. YC55]MDF7811481.1 hypothetical protein [Hymenobacter sp. YC55]